MLSSPAARCAVASAHAPRPLRCALLFVSCAHSWRALLGVHMARPSLAACTAPAGGLQPTLYTANRGGFASRFRVRPVLVVVLRLLILLRTTTSFTNCSSCSTLVSMASVSCVLRVSRRGLPPDATAACLLLFVVFVVWRCRSFASSALRFFCRGSYLVRLCCWRSSASPLVGEACFPYLGSQPVHPDPSCFVRISFKAVLLFFFGDPAFNLPAAVVSPSLAFDLIQFWLALKPQLFPSSGWTLAHLA